MTAIPITLAQAAGELPDPTPGQILIGLSFMAVMAGSMITIAVWGARFFNGREVMPFATRKPLYVPWPLTGFGLFMATMMAITVFASGTMDPELLGQQEDQQDVADLDSNPESEDNSASQDSDAIADDTAKPETETSESTDSLDATEETTLPSQPTDETEAETEVADEEKLSPVALKQRIRLVMIGNFTSNLVMFAIFGLTIFFFQMQRSRRQQTINDIGYETNVRPTPDSNVEQTPDSSPLASHTAIADSTNPYAVQPEEVSSNEITADQTGPLPLEKWNLLSELKFAFETFLVAFLPTTFIRVLFVSNAPETQKHPFLEMIENGVDGEIMAMIFVLAVFVAPIVEELMYRVAIFGGMYQRSSFGLGLVISSILFGMAHGYPDCFALLPLAIAIGFTYSRRRSYRTAVLVHFLFNGFNMLLAGLSML